MEIWIPFLKITLKDYDEEKANMGFKLPNSSSTPTGIQYISC